MKLLVLVDGSEPSNKAFEKALEIKQKDDELLIVHACQYAELQIYTLPGLSESTFIDPKILQDHHRYVEAKAHDICKAYKTKCEEKGLQNCHSFVITTTNDTKSEVLRFAQERQVDMIVVGSRGLGQVKRMLLGSFSTYISHHATCSVLVAK
eukprot:c15386_g1_i1.p1 GENE.c15386_g1_i1~~c15386_g1_i1.p1  ORF type:complete len:161 (+),score=69.84 c15386_g1_i1:29-484(+)